MIKFKNPYVKNMFSIAKRDYIEDSKQSKEAFRLAREEYNAYARQILKDYREEYVSEARQTRIQDY